MITDDERRRVAAALREYDGRGADADTIGEITALIIGAGNVEGWSWREIYARLADLIGPGEDPTEQGIDSIYDWCFSGLEGADEDEDELYCAIMRAIEDYRHPERVTARTARAVDREALLELENELTESYVTRGADGDEMVMSRGAVSLVARRIREACGVVA